MQKPCAPHSQWLQSPARWLLSSELWLSKGHMRGANPCSKWLWSTAPDVHAKSGLDWFAAAGHAFQEMGGAHDMRETLDVVRQRIAGAAPPESTDAENNIANQSGPTQT